MERFLLFVVRLFRPVFVILKTEFDQVYAIVAIKLKMDNRRSPATYRQKGKKEPGSAFIMTLFFYAVFGVFVAWALASINSFMVSMIMFYSYIIVMVAMTLITDFSSVLLDSSDNTIILPRPVDGRTLFAARITHILLYLGQLAAGLSLAPIVVAVVKYGWVFGIFFIAGILLAVITALFITNTVYLLIMQFTSEEKLKNIINYFQIVMAVAIMGGYQLLPRMLGRVNLEGYVFEIHRWTFFVPPVWIAGALEAIRFGTWDSTHITFTALALIVPVSGVYVASKYLTPVFTRKLGAMEGKEIQSASTQKTEKGNFIEKISAWITRSPFEQGAFDVIYKLLGRDRKIKLKVYPSYGYIIIFGLIFMLRDKEDFFVAWLNLPHTQYYLLLIYLTFMVVQVAIHEIPYSDDFKASWIYFSAPLDKPGEVLSGMLKAIALRLFIPGYIAISLFIILIWGVSALDDIVFGLLNNLIMLLILVLMNKRYLPLSMAPNARTQTGNLLRSIGSMLIIGLIGITHFVIVMLSDNNPLILLAITPLQILVIYFMLRSYRNTGWDQVTL